jgi:predicted alpha/beta hydrolase family esterase
MSDFQPTLIVPGLQNSDEEHWQSWWQQLDRNSFRVTQANWDIPDLGAWTNSLFQEVNESADAVWIVAHSFGCLASLQVVQKIPDRICGLLLVAPADPEKFGVAKQLPRSLEVPSILVSSQSDPWLSFEKAQHWAENLGSRFVDLGDAGHINSDSGFGAWQQGFDLFGRFKREISATQFCRFALS